MTKFTSLLGAALLVVGSTAEGAFTYTYISNPGAGALTGQPFPNASFSADPGMYGSAFTVTDPIFVTSLGIYDGGLAGLKGPHNVSIFTSAGTLVYTATVSSGSNLNGWVYAANLPSESYLGVGDYYIAADYTGLQKNGPGDTLISGSNATFTGGPRVTATPGSYSFDGNYLGISNPSLSAAGFLAGPNFQFTAAPEPAVAITNGLLLGGLGVMVWRRRKVARPEIA